MSALLRLLGPGLAVLAVALVVVREQVPLSGWPLLADFALVGFAVGAVLAAAAEHARGRGAKALLLSGVVAGAAGTGHLLLAPAAPGAMVVVVDCLGEDRFTPELMPRTHAALSDGWRFTDARAQSSWTRSAVPSLLTGRYPVEHGIYRLQPAPDRLRDGVETLAQVVDRAGWATAAFIDQAQLDPAFGLAAGYHRYNYRDGDARALQARFLTWHRFFRLVPRLAYLHYLDIHKPYLPGPEYAPAPTSALVLNRDTDWAGLMKAVNSGERTLSEAEWQDLEALHVAEIRELDDALGSLLEGLHADGTLETSWLLLTSDHGEAFGEHDFLTHGGLPYEELLQIPLVLRPPGGLEAPASIADPVQHVDMAPTLLARLGLPALAGASGRDFGPALRGEPMAAQPSFAEFYAHDEHIVSVREGSLKYLRDGERERLYDLAADPGEQRDIAEVLPQATERLRTLGAHYLTRSPLAEVDWSDAAGVPLVWPESQTGGVVADPRDESMEALRALGYIE